MKRYAFIMLLLVAACVRTPADTQTPTPPSGVHTAPGRHSVSLAPTRDGAVSVPAGFEGGPAGVKPVAQGETVRIGVLLPLTGRHAALGKTLLDAATLSLFDKYARLSTAQQQVRVELLPKDTGDTPEQARTAMQAALDEGAKLIIGPVFADATAAIAPLARAKGVSVISFTNNQAQAAPGVYAFGFSPQEQTARVVAYALGRGKGRVATLVPDSPTGELVLGAARSTLQASNAVPVAEAKYAPQGVGIETALAQLMPTADAIMFDSLLLPEGGQQALATILRALSTRGVTPQNVQFLGTGFWDEADLLRRTALTGAWLASSPPNLTAHFEQRFMNTYHYVPARISSLAYDAVALGVTLATSGRGFGPDALTQPAGYSGPANGIFRLRANGTVQRGLAVLEVRGADLIVIDPAPAGFTGAVAVQ